MPQNNKHKVLKQRVVISRRWSHPAIECIITDDEINLSTDLSSFQAALIVAIGTPPLHLTAAKRENWIAQRIRDACFEIVEEIKKASVHVV
jgi:hypothetical protein